MDRENIRFVDAVRACFSFLRTHEMVEQVIAPTLVRYSRGVLQVDIYHGRNSFEIGLEVTFGGKRYSIEEIIRITEPPTAANYRNYQSNSGTGIREGIENLGIIFKKYAKQVLDSDPRFFQTLEKQKKLWVECYALDVLADQLRPEAHEAFRRKDYARSKKLFEKIKTRLSESELKKLEFSEKKLSELR